VVLIKHIVKAAYVVFRNMKATLDANMTRTVAETVAATEAERYGAKDITEYFHVS